MQLMIDTETEPKEALIKAARILMFLAGSAGTDLMTEMRGGFPPPVKDPAPPTAPVASAPSVFTRPFVPPPPPVVANDETQMSLEEAARTAARVFGPDAITVVSEAVTATSNERDSSGLPWDDRVHSETRAKNQDGTWRFRRGLDADVKARVVAELSGVAVPPPPPAATVIPPPPPAAAVPVPPISSVGVPNTAQPVVLPVPPVIPPPPAAPAVIGFRALMQKINVAFAEGKLSPAQMQEAYKTAGISGLTELAAQPALIPTVDAFITQCIGS